MYMYNHYELSISGKELEDLIAIIWPAEAHLDMTWPETTGRTSEFLL
jgi:hypothetical protein